MPRVFFDRWNITEHDYTWDYTKLETAVALFDLGDKFILVTLRENIDDETGAMGDFRHKTWNECYVYSDETFQIEESFKLEKSTEVGCTRRNLEGDDLLITLTRVLNLRGIDNVLKVDQIRFPGGDFSLVGGNLIFDPTPGYKVKLVFERSDWELSRPNPQNYPETVIKVPIEGELPALDKSSLNDPQSRYSFLEFWIKERGEKVVVVQESWNECGYTDDRYIGPFSVKE